MLDPSGGLPITILFLFLFLYEKTQIHTRTDNLVVLGRKKANALTNMKWQLRINHV